MKKLSMRFLSVLLVVMMIATLAGLGIFAASAADTNGNAVANVDITDKGTWGGIDWTLSADGTLTIAPTKGKPTQLANKKAEFKVGEWPEAVRYDSNGAGAAIEGWPYDRTAVKKLVIEEGVTSIGSFADQGFTNLTGEVVIPSTVTYIGQEAFQKSTFTKLTFAEVAEGGTKEELCIAQGAFKDLIIEKVALPADRPVHLHAWVFNNCHHLKTAYLPATLVSVHGTNHIDYFKDFNAHSDPTWTKSSGIFAYNENMKTLVFGSEEVMDMFYANNNGTSKDYFVAVSGLTSYTSLTDAIEASQNGEVVKLIKNVTEDVTIPDGATVVLDLNGKTLYGAILPCKPAALTVSNGSIINNNSGVSGIEINAGELTLTNVNIDSARHAVRIDGAVTATIDGGEYKSISTSDTRHAVNVSGAANVTIISGTFVGPKGTTMDSGSAVCVQAGATVTINGGDFSKGKNATLGVSGTLTVYGGTFDQDPTAYVADGYMAVKDANGVYSIAKAVAKIEDTYYATLADAFTAAQDGDEVKILVAGTYALSTSGKDITITGAVDGVVFDNIGAKNMGGANVTFNNVTFDYYPNVNYTGLQHSGNLKYNDCTFNGQVFLYGASETFNNCVFNQNSADAYNVWTYGAKKVEFNGCTFNSAGKSVLIYAEDASIFNEVYVNDCDFIASAPVDGKAAIEMDSSLTAGIKLTIDGLTTVSGFSIGNVSGNSLWNNKKDNKTEANNDITVIVDGKTVLAPLTGTINSSLKTYVDASRVALSLELKNISALNELRIELWSNGTHISTTTYNKGGYVGKALTASIVLKGSSSSWTTNWLIDPNVDYIPDEIRVYADGMLVDTRVKDNHVFTDKNELAKFIAWDCVYKAATVTDANGNVTYFGTLQGAIDSIGTIAGDYTVTLMADCAEDVIVTQAPNVKITIDGADKTFTGTITVDGKSAAYATAGLTIKNVNFVATNISKDASINLGGNNNTRYTSNVTVQNCTFTGNIADEKVAIKNYTGGCKNLSVVGCTATGMHSLVQVKGVTGLIVSGCTINNCKNGIAVGTSTAVVIKDTSISATGYGIRADGTGAYDMTIENVTINAELPIVVRNATGAYELTLEGTNTLNASNTDGYQVIFTNGDDGTYEMPTGKFELTGADGFKVYPVFEYPVAIGDKKYESIQDAVNAAQNGDVITVLKSHALDITCGVLNSDGYYTLINVADKAVTIDLNGCTLTVDVTNLPAGTENNMLLGVFAADTNGKLTLKDSGENGSVSVTGGATKTIYSLVIAYEGLVNIEGGSYYVDHMNEGRGMIYGNVGDHANEDGSNKDTGVNISGGNFTLGNVGTLANQSPWILSTAGSNTGNYVYVTGGTFNDDINHQYWIFEVEVPYTLAMKSNGNGTWTVVDAVAYVKEYQYSEYYAWIGYATFAEAYDAAEEGETIVLLKDVTICDNLDKNVVIKKGETTVTFESNVVITAGAYDWSVYEWVATGYGQYRENGLLKIVKIEGASRVTVSESLTMTFVLKYDILGQLAASGENFYAVITGSDEKIGYRDWTFYQNDGVWYVGLKMNSTAAKQMTDLISFSVYYEDGTPLITYTDSIERYALRQLSDDSVDDLLKTMLVDMLNYGADAQKYFKYHLDDLANAELTDEMKALATDPDTLEEITNERTATSEDENSEQAVAIVMGAYGGMRLGLEDKVTVTFGFYQKFDDIKISFTNFEGELVEVTDIVWQEGRGYWFIEIDELHITDLYSNVDLTMTIIVDGVKTVVLTDSVAAYIKRQCDESTTNANLKQLLQSLRLFATSGSKYFLENQ